MNTTRRNLCVATSLLPLARWANAADAGFPSKPMRIVVPLGPGSAFDSATRVFADQLSKDAGQPVIVENKPGADTAIGVRDVMGQPPDGYNLLALSGSMVSINQFVIKNLTYDPREIRPVAGLLRNSAVFVVAAESPLKSWKQVVEMSRKEPGSISLANYGQIYRIGCKHFENLADIRFNHVPYKAAAQVATDLIGGNVNLSMMETGGVLPFIRSGKLRALAVTSAQRVSALPDIPTVAELGWPDYTLTAWTAYAVSRKTPEPIVKALQDMVLKAGQTETMKSWMADRLAEPMPYTAEQMDQLITRETALFGPLLKDITV